MQADVDTHLYIFIIMTAPFSRHDVIAVAAFYNFESETMQKQTACQIYSDLKDKDVQNIDLNNWKLEKVGLSRKIFRLLHC